MRRWIWLALLLIPTIAFADHIGGHATPCDDPATVGGGALGVSPGPVGPPDSLGWDVGSGQCNGSFASTVDGAFTGGAIELALRAEERRIGQVGQVAPGEYEVQLGHDTTAPAATNRAWWNFQASIAYGGNIDDLDSLTLDIQTLSGPNLPAAGLPADLLALRAAIDDRNGNPGNATSTYADLYQISQNPEFGWFAPTSDTDANPTGDFDYAQEGAWLFTIAATEGASSASVTVCIRTPGASCQTTPLPGFSYRAAIVTGVLLTLAIVVLVARRLARPAVA